MEESENLHAHPNSEALLAEYAQALFDSPYSPSQGREKYGLEFMESDTRLATWCLAARTEEWFALLKQPELQPLTPQGGKRRIAIFAIYPWWLTYFVAIAIVMRRLGHSVTLVWMPYMDPERPNENWESALIEREMADLVSRIEDPDFSVVDLSSVAESIVPEEVEELIHVQSKVDTSIHKKSGIIDYATPENEAHFAFRYERNRNCAAKLLTFMDEQSFSTWISHSGSAIEFGIMHKLVRRKGERVAEIEFAWRFTEILLTVNNEFSQFNAKGAWQAGISEAFGPVEREKVLARAYELEEAKTGDKRWLTSFQTSLPETDAQQLRDQLGIVDGKPTAVLFGHVDWDSTALVSDANTIFEGFSAWVEKTVKYFAEQPSLQLIIRPHPLETKLGSIGRLAHLVREMFPQLPPNVVILEADAPVNSYSLMRLADLGMVYMTDAGYEMVLRGRPVISAGNAKFVNCGITYDPNSEEEYFKLLEKFKNNNLSIKVRNIDNAIRFAYIYWEQIYKYFPWRVYHLWEQLEATSMSEMLSLQSLQRYSDIFAALDGSFNDYDGMVGFVKDN